MKKVIYSCGIISVFIAIISSTAYYFYTKKPTNEIQVSNIQKRHNRGVKNNAGIPNNYDNKGNQAYISLTKNAQNQSGTNNMLQGFGNKVKDKPLYPKEVFLTFDDGPSVNTLKILKILDENNEKATFFLVGKNVDNRPDLVRDEYSDGMDIENHSYTHAYSMYKGVESTMEDFNKCNLAIKNTIGIEPFHFIRFPGGSDNRVSKAQVMKDIRNSIVASGKDYVDWNTSSGDAAAGTVPVNTIVNNLLKQLSVRNFAVILMHDAPEKTTTVEALPKVIQYLKSQNFIFRTFNDLTPTEEKKMIQEGIIDRGADRNKLRQMLVPSV